MLRGATDDDLPDSSCAIISDIPFRFSCNYFAVLGLRNIPLDSEPAENIVDNAFWIGYHPVGSNFDALDNDDNPLLEGSESILPTSDFAYNNTTGSTYGGTASWATSRAVQPDNDGFFIRSVEQTDEMVHAIKIRFDSHLSAGGNPLSFQLGSVFIGNTYEFPHRADMNMSITHDFSGGIKETTTMGGASLTNIDYYKPPNWAGGLEPWQLHGRPSRSLVGRRSWDMSFSYLTETTSGNSNAVMPDNYNTDDEDASTYNYVSKNSFYNKVIQGTMGGALPFIFQPNKNVDEFALCKLDMKKFTVKKTAPTLASVKLRIKEVW